MQWPPWCDWELDCSNPHLAKRMLDRSFNEMDLRAMLAAATQFRADVEQARYIIRTSHGGRAWEVIVEPDASVQLLVVVTAYPLE